jgi:chemotaxis protein MotB
MIGNRARMLGLAALILASTLFGGCTNSLKAERDKLWAQNQELQDELNRARSALDAAESDLSARDSELQSLRAQPAPTAAANTGFDDIAGVETFQQGGTITVRVPGDVLFASGKVDLKSTAKSTLDQIAAVIQRDYASNVIRVEGHTDNDPIRKSTWTDNLELSLERAAAVHRYLQTRGVSADRMYAAGYGDTRPQESKARSRRVEIVVVLQE